MQSNNTCPSQLQKQNQQTIDFINQNQNTNPKDAALKASNNPNVNVAFAVNQISGKQIAKTKLPIWYKNERVIYPAHISMEQCSSQATAQYKARLANRLIKNNNIDKCKTTLIDLTGGFGVDCAIMSQEFNKAICVEKQEELSAISQHNMIAMGLNNVQCINSTSVEALEKIDQATLIYIDPARRDKSGARTYAIEDCTPNVLELKSHILRVAQFLLIKLSPMLDWKKAVCDFSGSVSQIHIVSHNNECKELLLVLDSNMHSNVDVYCVNNDSVTVFNAKYNPDLNKVEEESQELHESQEPDTKNQQSSNVLSINNWSNWAKYVYEPNASIMKSGCFRLLSSKYNVLQIASNSHVFISCEYESNFPGNIWKIDNIFSLNKKEISKALLNVTYANIATYNFPLSVNDLKKRLKLKDGGKTRIIATTDSKNNHVIIRASSTQSK
ncbi:THUMP-like domain-containing protein [Gardnerella vaginalis]|uniref:Uncharacterized protein n=1 Tax=Gardnerella vaginalis TaxID=2702 RepID=A0A133NP12_GARVA|nr:hypothetical protein [Gardnerella vaginalis]KXA18025.1 hypothetical protein HMPREF3216_00812 [Gardnerella vaginalis]